MNPALANYIAFALSILALLVAVFAVWQSRRKGSLRKFFQSKDPENFEEIVEHIIAKLGEFDEHSKQTLANFETVMNQLNTATQHVGIVRYNSSGDDGGNLSFSTALLDAHQSGIIITSLHGRQNNRIYAKIITAGASEQMLSEEEREALILALTNKQLQKS